MPRGSANEEAIVVADAPESDDNRVQPFRIEGQDVRGRAVRLGTVADQVLNAHDYPLPVARLLGEALALTAMLGSMLKTDGSLNLQTKSDGPVGLLIADYRMPGEVRGYAQFDRAAAATLQDGVGFEGLMGDGYLAMTLDQGGDSERYQGIVELKGRSLSDCARSYFIDSEQTPSEVALAAKPDPVTGFWRAGGIMVQHLGRGEEGRPRLLEADQSEAWNRAAVLMSSVRHEELTDPLLPLNDLLFRLFHEDGVRVFRPTPVVRGCRCSQERIGRVLGSFPKEDLEDMADNGRVTVTCEFCNRDHVFEI